MEGLATVGLNLIDVEGFGTSWPFFSAANRPLTRPATPCELCRATCQDLATALPASLGRGFDALCRHYSSRLRDSSNPRGGVRRYGRSCNWIDDHRCSLVNIGKHCVMEYGVWHQVSTMASEVGLCSIPRAFMKAMDLFGP